MTQPDPIAVTYTGSRLLVRCFARRSTIEKLIASKGADEVLFIDTPLIRIELSLHESPEEVRQALTDLAEKVALAATEGGGAA
jgi:hypothetical protein